MKPTISVKPSNIGNRKKISFIIIRCDELSDRGYNIAIEVYQVNFKTGKLEIIGSDYAIQSGGWKGEQGAALYILNLAFPDLKNDGYRISDNRVIDFQKV